MLKSRTSVLAAIGLLACCGLFSVAKVDPAQAQRTKGYYVILGSFGDRAAARQRSGSHCLRDSDERIRVIDSDNIDGFRPGLWVVVAGPFRSETRAQDVKNELRRCVRDAYYKYGRDVDD
jgi:hypothetical protein